MTTNRYMLRRYFLMTLDPVHPGAGGYRLGRVDNSIIRDPGTRLPKIPGSSLHGAARSYAAYLYETPEAAGQKQDKVQNPEQNPVCYTFGYIKGKTAEGSEQIAFSGVVNIFDAQILLFPVHSMCGPVWVSTAQRLREAGFDVSAEASAEPPEDKILTTLQNCPRLNLGWLMLEAMQEQPVTVEPPNEWKDKMWDSIKDRIVLVNDSLFSQVVNSNLEVRTSVAIDPKTGAAEDKALYTYEAIPRAAFVTAEVVLDDYVADENKARPFPKEKTEKDNPLPKRWESPLDVVQAGLQMMEYLGVGGMGTRGFGRIKIVGEPIDTDPTKEFEKSEAQA